MSLMEKNGMGTDASILVHINNICKRHYVQVRAGRRLYPTVLGTSLIRVYQCIDPDLCLPDIRSFIEHQISLVAKGQADHSIVVEHVIEQFKRKFIYFVKQIENMDALFEAEFSPLSDSGRVLSKCGKCLRYMKHISSQTSRLYCATCEEIYYTPQKGTIKIGSSVSIKSLFDLTKIVAKGVVCSMDPNTEVGRQTLGPNWCEIQVLVVLEREESLIRPYDLLQKVGIHLEE